MTPTPESALRPLASPVVECFTSGWVQFIGGVALLTVDLIDGEMFEVLRAWIVGAALVGGLMYVLGYRPYGQRATVAPPEAPTKRRETLFRTRLRTGRAAVLYLIFLAVVVAMIGDAASMASIVAGNGLALLALGRRLQSWESERSRRLLREPRWRWRGPERGTLGGGVPISIALEPSGSRGRLEVRMVLSQAGTLLYEVTLRPFRSRAKRQPHLHCLTETS
jgi:hypothetical protein